MAGLVLLAMLAVRVESFVSIKESPEVSRANCGSQAQLALSGAPHESSRPVLLPVH